MHCHRFSPLLSLPNSFKNLCWVEVNSRGTEAEAGGFLVRDHPHPQSEFQAARTTHRKPYLQKTKTRGKERNKGRKEQN